MLERFKNHLVTIGLAIAIVAIAFFFTACDRPLPNTGRYVLIQCGTLAGCETKQRFKEASICAEMREQLNQQAKSGEVYLRYVCEDSEPHVEYHYTTTAKPGSLLSDGTIVK